MEVKDKYSLMAFGLKRKAAWIRKKAILDAVFELKRRFKVVLFRFLERREQKNFEDLQDLILNFDKKPGYEEEFKKELAKKPKLSNFKQSKIALEAVALKDEIPLGIVSEENEDELEQST